MEFLLTHANKLLLFSVLSICAYTDLKERRIPNLVTYPAMILGISLNYFCYGSEAFSDALQGLFFLGLAGLIFALLHWIGYGDWKLLMVLGGVMGIYYSLGLLFLTSLCMGLFTVFAVVFSYSGIHTPFFHKPSETHQKPPNTVNLIIEEEKNHPTPSNTNPKQPPQSVCEPINQETSENSRKEKNQTKPTKNNSKTTSSSIQIPFAVFLWIGFVLYEVGWMVWG